MQTIKLINVGIAIGILIGGIIRLFMGMGDIYLYLSLTLAIATLFVWHRIEKEKGNASA